MCGFGGVIFKECDSFLHFGRQRGDRLTFLTVHGIWKHSAGEKISTELDPNPISNAYLLLNLVLVIFGVLLAPFVKWA